MNRKDASRVTATDPRNAAKIALDPVAPKERLGAGQNGENITDSIADIVAQQLIQANPQGPQSTAAGIQLLAPSATMVAAYLATAKVQPAVLQPSIDDSRIQVIKNYSVSDLSHYLDVIAEVQNALSSGAIVQAAPSQISPAAASDWLASATQQLNDAEKELYAVKVPEPIVPFHRSLLSFFLSVHTYSNLVGQDPVGATALESQIDGLVTQEIASLQKANEDLQKNMPNILSRASGDKESPLAQLLGVRIAHAQIPVTDIAHITATITNWLHEFWNEIKTAWQGYLLGILKTALLKALTQKIIAWASGQSGTAGYVASWLTFAANTAIAGNNRTVDLLAAKLCGNSVTGGVYADIIASALKTNPQINSGPTTDFSTAGDGPDCPAITAPSDGTFAWDSFLNSTVHNPWGDVITVGDQAKQAAAAAASAAVNEAIAGQGYTGVKKCQDGSAVNNEGTCKDGSQAQIITPGTNKRDLTSKGLTYIYDLITSANNENLKETLAAAVADAVVSSVIRKGNGLFEPSSTSGGGTAPTPGATLDEQLGQYDDLLSQALDDTQIAIDSYNQTIEVLQGALPSCDESTGPQVQELISGFQEALPGLQASLARIQNLLDIVKQFEQNPSAHTLAELQGQVGSFNSIVAIANQARQDRTTASAATADAGNVLQSCRPQ